MFLKHPFLTAELLVSDGIQIEHTLVLKNGGFEFIVPQPRELVRI